MTAEVSEFIVDILHEVTEVQAKFVVKFQVVEKQIHEPGFSTANISPQI